MTSTRIAVRLQPRASRDEILGWREDGVLRARVKAPPVDGAANNALVQIVAKALGVPRNKVMLVSGVTTRNKILVVEGLTNEVISERLSQL
ncbi:MAG: DUF167 domain-containing protein [Chloroflexi bacterium]|nr:DUF167 domain-containing protein [Chloroflexota bacterium]